MTELGRLLAVPAREVWTHEANDFTPWLARPENIALLAQTLSLGEVEVEATEMGIGRFSADIVARDETGALVLIENQLEATDHRHLGQVLTYLAGLEGDATVVWIATEFREEHRAAIDWLNANTNERFDFFGVEIEVVRIDSSLPAPRFSVVAKPNNWSRAVSAVSRQAAGGGSGESCNLYMSFWGSFAEYLREKNAPFAIRRAKPSHWCSFPIGGKGFGLAASIKVSQNCAGVDVYRKPDDGKIAFRKLLADREEIEKEFGEPLDWQELPDKRMMRIAIYLKDAGVRDPGNFPAIQAWMLDRLLRFRKVFRNRIMNMDLGSIDSEVDEVDEGPMES